MKIEDIMNMENGWYKIIYNPNMETDYWTPNDEIGYIEFDKNNKCFKTVKTWHRWDKVVNRGIVTITNKNMFKDVRLIHVVIDVEANPKDERITKILENKDDFR